MNRQNKWKLRASTELLQSHIHIYLSYSEPVSSYYLDAVFDGDNIIHPTVEDKIVFKDDIPEGATREPILSINQSNAQQLMDDLWRCGLRPTEGKGSAGALKAVEYHLEDMRNISNRLLDDKLKEPKIEDEDL